jgi:16S rRNA (cytidine1402-2'-O)-methyltransferase
MSAQTNEKERGWLLPATKKKEAQAGLYLIATPIGNLSDITLRALDILSAVDLIVCEDTRVTGKLLDYYGIKKPLLPYNDHNAAGQRGPLLEKLKAGQKIAMVSDAGTPAFRAAERWILFRWIPAAQGRRT